MEALFTLQGKLTFLNRLFMCRCKHVTTYHLRCKHCYHFCYYSVSPETDIDTMCKHGPSLLVYTDQLFKKKSGLKVIAFKFTVEGGFVKRAVI